MAVQGLTPRQARFIEEYGIDLNATQAAIRAGYSTTTARQMGTENLSKPVIANAIAAAQKARSERTEITQDEVVRGLYREATLGGNGASHAARVSAWALLGRHIGMFSNKLDVNVRADLAVRLAAARKRVGARDRDGVNRDAS